MFTVLRNEHDENVEIHPTTCVRIESRSLEEARNLSFRRKLWNIVLSGYPSSGKTVLSKRLVSDNPTFVRLSVDDVRSMFYGVSQPSADEEFVYTCLASLRDLALRRGLNVIVDCTAPRNSTREFLLSTKVEDVVPLLVVMVVSRDELERRNRERNLVGAIEAWDKTREPSLSTMPVMKFHNDSRADFETSYYVLTELLKSNVSPYRRRFMEHMFPGI